MSDGDSNVEMVFAAPAVLLGLGVGGLIVAKVYEGITVFGVEMKGWAWVLLVGIEAGLVIGYVVSMVAIVVLMVVVAAVVWPFKALGRLLRRSE